MKKIYFCCILFISFNLFGQTLFSKQEIEKDMRFIKLQIEEHHPSPYNLYSKINFDSKFDSLVSTLTDKTTLFEACKYFRGVLSLAGDSHMNLLKSPSSGMKDYLKYQNIQFKFESNLLFGRFPEVENWLKIDSVNHHSVRELVLQTKLYLPADQGNIHFLHMYLISNLSVLSQIFFGKTEKLTLHFENEDHYFNAIETNQKTITAVPNYDLSLGNKSGFNFETEHKGILKWGSFNFKGFKRKVNNVFKQIEKSKIDTLVLDLRGNTGGNLYNAFYLMSFFVNHPLILEFKRPVNEQNKISFDMFFKRFFVRLNREFFASVHKSKTDDWKSIVERFPPQQKHQFNGILIIKVDGFSLSSSSMTASYLSTFAHAILEGNYGGGTFENYGGGWLKLKLPETKIKFRVSQYVLDYGI